jgi:hypothetical protein
MAYQWIFMELIKAVLWMYLLGGNTCPQVLDIVFKNENFERFHLIGINLIFLIKQPNKCIFWESCWLIYIHQGVLMMLGMQWNITFFVHLSKYLNFYMHWGPPPLILFDTIYIIVLYVFLFEVRLTIIIIYFINDHIQFG